MKLAQKTDGESTANTTANTTARMTARAGAEGHVGKMSETGVDLAAAAALDGRLRELRSDLVRVAVNAL